MTSRKKVEKKSKTYGKLMKTLSKNYWAISTIVLATALIASLFMGGFGEATISSEKAGQKIVDFLSSQGTEAEVVSVSEVNGLYEVTLSANGEQGALYITKDGNNLIPQPIPLTARAIQDIPQETEAPASTAYSEQDLTKIKAFSQCLADNGVKAYGAGWCGYCKKLKEAFGGEEQITPFYLECQNADRTPTEYADLCQQEEIRGFPTIKINGEPYNGARTIAGLASAIEECNAPKLEGTQAAPTQQGSTPYTDEDLIKLKTFNDCLGEKDVKIYGANWCGWTKKWVIETLGGFDTASAIYVECIENTELCSSEGVTGYPTTKINGEVYTGDRTIAAIAQATGCPEPKLTGSAPATPTTAAGCGA